VALLLLIFILCFRGTCFLAQRTVSAPVPVLPPEIAGSIESWLSSFNKFMLIQTLLVLLGRSI
jgi:hypothetical protein